MCTFQPGLRNSNGIRLWLFWDVMQHWLVVNYWCFRTTYWLSCSLRTKNHPHHFPYNYTPNCSRHSSWTAWPMKMGLLGYPETSVTTNQCCTTSQKSKDLIYTVAEAWITHSNRIDHPIQLLLRYLFPLVKQPGHETD
jgi:hypothetical protein